MGATAEYGVGIYTAPEAARMIGMGAKTLRRWLVGYEYEHGGQDTTRPALWNPQYRIEDGELLLGFRDLIEARIVNALKDQGISLQAIRTCLNRARALLGDAHPLSTRQFKTDGKSIFLEITDGLPEPRLIDLKRRQGVFHRVVQPSFKDLDFGPQAAERWWLITGKRSLVADPEFAFGQPTIAGHNMTTARVAQAVRAEGSAARVARMFELRPGAVRDAVAFERRAAPTRRAASATLKEHRGERRAA